MYAIIHYRLGQGDIRFFREGCSSSARARVISSEKAADTIGRLCVCGIFNQKRYKEIFDDSS